MRSSLRQWPGRRAACLMILGAASLVVASHADDRPRVPEARSALEPAAPPLPAEVVAALQEGRFDDAAGELQKLQGPAQTSEDERAYFALVRGAVLRLNGALEPAREALTAALEKAPGGTWAAKLRAELAALEVAAGRFAEAEALARSQAEALLATPRKDALAEVYETFAARLLRPIDPLVPADPAAAHALLEQGRRLARGPATRARMLLAMARASQAAGNPGLAIAEFTAYLNEYEKADLPGADLDAARYGLGESQLAAGQAVEARRTWDDLVRPTRPNHSGDRARALFGISRTYGIPAPPDDGALNLGTNALRRFLEAYPAHPLAPRAAYEIGQARLHRGKSQEAIESLRDFLAGKGYRAETDEARRDLTELTMTASFQIAQILQGQSQFDEAITAFQDYLAKFPNGPQSADAQRGVLEARLLIAQDHERHERREAAREAWSEFVARNPLDPRVAGILFQIAGSFRAEKKYDEAIAGWELVASKFPGTEPAGHAQFEIALIFENQKGDPEAALSRYRKIAVEPWKSQAAQRVAAMEAKALTVVTPRAFRTGETPSLTITTRNLERLTFTAYRLDPETYFRKKHGIGGVEALDIGLVAPDHEWTADVPGFKKYRSVESSYNLKVESPGVFVVKVTDETSLQATTLVLGSDIDAIFKASREQALVFVQDMKTGRGRPQARVLISDGTQIIVDQKTGEDGVLLRNWENPREGNSRLSFLVLDGPHSASNALGVPDSPSQGLTARAYLMTDRPAYRPGQRVEIRGVVREVRDGLYDPSKGAEYRLEVTDSRGRTFLARPVTLSAFGTFAATVDLDSAAAAGMYRMRLYQPGKSDFAAQFTVEAYQLEKVDLSFDLPRTVYYRGETIEGALVARYQYGTPLANRPITLQLPDGRIVNGSTDTGGRFPFELETVAFGESQGLTLTAQLPQDNVAATAVLMIAVQGFSIAVETRRSVYLDGESFSLDLRTVDALAKPIGQELTIRVIRQISRPDSQQPGVAVVSEKEVQSLPVRTDAETGRATVTLKVEDEDGGNYLVRAAGTDRFGNPVVTDHALTISGSKDEEKLRILADRPTYKVGESATVRLLNRGPAGVALLAWEADRILRYQVAPIETGENPLEWEVDGAQFPNFTLTASRMAGVRYDSARLDVLVQRQLQVAVKPAKEATGPGEEFALEIETKDQLGRPVAAEVSIALIDQALLRRFPDPLPPIDAFFYNQRRTGSFATEATNPFQYHPATVPVPQAMVEDAARTAGENSDLARRGEVLREVQGQVAFEIPQEPMAAPEAALGMGMAGGMGGEGRVLMSDQPAPDVIARRKSSWANGYGYFTERDDRPHAPRSVADLRAKDARFEEDLDFRKSMDSEGLAAGRLGEVRAVPRAAFVETAYWNPSVRTDEQGKARITLKAPTALSRYQFRVRGVTGAETLVGQTSAEIRVKKDFFVDLKRPASLTQGDRPRFAARLHHSGVSGKVDVVLKVNAGGREQTFPRSIELKGDGVDDLSFDPFEVPEGDVVRITLTARAGGSSDELLAEVPIRPFGIQAFASASGRSTDDAATFVALPGGRAYENPEMVIVVSPSPRQMLIEMALGTDPRTLESSTRWCFPVPPQTVAGRATELLAAASVLDTLRSRGGVAGAEASRLADRIRGLASELLTLQNDDGGWPWVAGEPGRPSDRTASARAFWALAAVQPLGLLSDPGVLDRGANYLQAAFNATDASDSETRAVLLHALSTRHLAGFEAANALNRGRAGLSDAGLAYLALTFANLERRALALEVLSVLTPRAKTEAVAPGLPSRRYWEGGSRHPGLRGPAEATALAALAYSRALPDAPELRGAADWLIAHREVQGWQPETSRGPAVAALATYFSGGEPTDDRYRLIVTVNEREVQRLDVKGPAPTQTIRVPREAIKPGDRNVVRFDIEGRGTFAWSATLTGFTRDFAPEQDHANRSFRVTQHIFMPDAPELDGRSLPTGFDVAVGARFFENWAHQVELGGRLRVRIDTHRVYPPNQPVWERDYLVLEDHLPAGTTLVAGSVQTVAQHYELGDGTIRFYFAPDQEPGQTSYDVYGYLPGAYRTIPPILFSAYEPGRRVMPAAGVYDLKVLSPDEPKTDPYQPTPGELYARGKAHFDAGRFPEAEGPLEALWTSYTLTEPVAKDSARMLLMVHLKAFHPAKIVQYFEILKEKMPELVLPFDEVLVVGRAYRDLGEFERAYLVWKALSEASYLEDARLGELLRQRGQALPALALLINLWREYPSTASIESDFLGLGQLAASLAARATSDPGLRRELAEAGKSRSDLLLQSIRLTQTFLSLYPRNPLADEASLALVGAFLELEDFDAVVKLSARFATLYPKSPFADSFQYSEALGRFHLGEYDRAIEVATAIAETTYTDANGVEQPSPNKWQALYIIGQIHDARRQPAQAIEYYDRVAQHFTDAAEAARFLKHKALSLPEVTVVRPTAVAVAEGLRSLRPAVDVETKDRVVLTYRNIASVEVKVYPVDLLQLYLTRRNLDGIAGIDLAGITPLVERTVELGDGQDFDQKRQELELAIDREGAYLVMVRGGELYASGILLVSPIEAEVTEEAAAGRVRVRVRDAATKAPVAKVKVRVIGSENPAFYSGETDLRGLFVAEGVRGQVTALARTDAPDRKDSPRYAFYRGTTHVGAPAPSPSDPGSANAPTAPDAAKPMTLEQNVQQQNSANQLRQIERLEKRYNAAPQGGADLKGFK